MDVNLNADVKGYGMPVVATVELEDRSQPQVKPVQQGGESGNTNLDDRALHGRSVEEQKARSLSEEDSRKAIEEVQKRLDVMGNRLQLSLSKDPESVVVQVIDRKSGELIRQFPPEELLSLQKKLADLVGLLFDEKA